MLAAMELLGFAVLLGLPLGYLALQTRLLRRWHSGWRLAAAAPLPFWLMWAARFAWDTTLDPTSHNLFPFEILIGAPPPRCSTSSCSPGRGSRPKPWGLASAAPEAGHAAPRLRPSAGGRDRRG